MLLPDDFTVIRQSLSTQYTKSKYVDTRFVVAILNVCEWLFSVAAFTMGGRRKGMF